MVTGGPETLHQLAKLYKDQGNDVSMFYVDPHVLTVPERFKIYDIDVANSIEDSSDNILIVPETSTYILNKYKKIKVCIWWLSLDNYKRMIPSNMVRWRAKVHNTPVLLYPVVFLYLLSKKKFHFAYYKFNDRDHYYHAYNCEYAHQFLLSNGIKEEKTIYLCGPLMLRSELMVVKTADKIRSF